MCVHWCLNRQFKRKTNHKSLKYYQIIQQFIAIKLWIFSHKKILICFAIELLFNLLNELVKVVKILKAFEKSFEKSFVYLDLTMNCVNNEINLIESIFNVLDSPLYLLSMEINKQVLK